MENRNTSIFFQQSIYYLELNTPRIQKCLDQLSEQEVWQRPNDSSNSVGNLILHLCGNITQYILSGLGGKQDLRERDTEFESEGGVDKEELILMLSQVVSEASNVINSLSEEQLNEAYQVQGYDHTGISIIIHVVEHYSYHTGQIAFWTKLLKDQDLGFYAGQDLNVRNR